MCMSMNFAKYLKSPILENICERLLLKIGNFSLLYRSMSFAVQSCLTQMVRAGIKREAYDK